jgi:hypothetical protein
MHLSSAEILSDLNFLYSNSMISDGLAKEGDGDFLIF